MAEVSRARLAAFIEQTINDVAAHEISTGPHSIQCLGAEASSGATSASFVALTNPKRSAREKRSLEVFARELRRQEPERGADASMSFDLRTLPPGHRLNVESIRQFYALFRTVRLTNAADQPVSVQAWAFTSHDPSTPFPPLALRVTLEKLCGGVIAVFDDPSPRAFRLAVRGGALREALHVLARLFRLDALALWQFDETMREFRTVAVTGMKVSELSLPVRSRDSTPRRGIVAQLSPNGPPVVFDAEDPTLWHPRHRDEWAPFDTQLFRDHAWRSCIALPISSGGRLVGALSAYSRRAASVFRETTRSLQQAADNCTEMILLSHQDAVITALAERYDEELLTANVSLSALSLSHDVLHYYRTVEQQIKEAAGYLATNQLAAVREALSEAELATEHTEPALRAMRRLATEARSSRSRNEVALTSDPAALFAELERLLKAILPSFSHSKRLTAEDVVLTVDGNARPIAVSEMALERIVVNLCVNSAQWGARHVWVDAHFNRTVEEVQLVVRDDGRGIPSSHRDQVFDRFYSGRKGSGLGLYVVKSMATRAGGDVYLQSYDYSAAEDQRGTIVTVVLPTPTPEVG